MRKKVVAALSGGVDSSVAAALAVKSGYEVIGVTLRMKHPDPEFSRAQLCASKNDEMAVDSVVKTLGIEHHYLDMFAAFEEKVLRHAALEYCAGRTPNPCCDCNLLIKFGTMAAFAETVGAEKVLTGHYAKIVETDNAFAIERGDDVKKDQSYFLYRLTQKELAKISFPVGNLEKTLVRQIAADLGLVTSGKPDSQDACFQVPGECFGETLRKLFGLPAKKGLFIYRQKIVGRHNGIHQYTIGQRKGLNVALGVPAYIAAIDPESGNITLETDPATLACPSFLIKNVNWQSGNEPQNLRLLCQTRYRSTPVEVELAPHGGGDYRADVLSDLRAVTPGQAAVFYQNKTLLGGGVIDLC